MICKQHRTLSSQRDTKFKDLEAEADKKSENPQDWEDLSGLGM